MAFAAAFLVILLTAPTVFATDYNIDWSLGSSYSNWATKSLNAGDKLVFTYDSTHTVDVVSKDDYENCVAGNALEKHTTSPTTITLKEGPAYIICGTAGHCAGGMKLQVNAKASGGSSPSSPTPSGSSPATPTGNTPSASGNGASSFSSGNLMFGVPLVLGTLFAFVG